MTLKELSQLYYLNREIEMDKRRLQELEAQAVSCTPTSRVCRTRRVCQIRLGATLRRL